MHLLLKKPLFLMTYLMDVNSAGSQDLNSDINLDVQAIPYTGTPAPQNDDGHAKVAAVELHKAGLMHAQHLDEEGHLNLEPKRIFEVATSIIKVIEEERAELIGDFQLEWSGDHEEHPVIKKSTGGEQHAKEWLGGIVKDHHEQMAEDAALDEIRRLGPESTHLN